jgi:hypothetical protein
MKKSINNPVIWFLVLLSVSPLWAVSSEPNTGSVFKQEELDQLLAPIALYPDSLLAQIFMASTYPLEVVQAEKWVRDSNSLKGDELTKALEGKSWDPSVKSLVNFPDVLQIMSENLDLTQKLGDAFLSQQKDVMATVQTLRKKAQEQGNLKTSEQQVVTGNQQVIIESNDPGVTYVPEYDPYTVYGGWWYPAYPPYYWYPGWHIGDLRPRPTPYSLRNRVEAGPAWGYAWGGCDWRDGTVGIDVGRNKNLNQNINRDYYARNYQKAGQLDQSGKGTWQHNPNNRRGVAYRDQATAQRYNRASTADLVQSREAYRGRAEQGRQDIGRGGVNNPENRQGTAQRPRVDQKPASRDTSGNISNRGGALDGIDSGNAARNASNRGQMSRQGMPSPQPQMRTPSPQAPMRMSPGGGMRGGGGRR